MSRQSHLVRRLRINNRINRQKSKNSLCHIISDPTATTPTKKDVHSASPLDQGELPMPTQSNGLLTTKSILQQRWTPMLILFVVVLPLNSSCKLHEDAGKVVDVSGFHPSMELMKDVTVGTLITAVDLQDETIIAVFHQGLYFGKSMEHSLAPAKLWDDGITCDITPKWASKGKSIHGIYSPDDNV